MRGRAERKSGELMNAPGARRGPHAKKKGLHGRVEEAQRMKAEAQSRQRGAVSLDQDLSDYRLALSARRSMRPSRVVAGATGSGAQDPGWSDRSSSRRFRAVLAACPFRCGAKLSKVRARLAHRAARFSGKRRTPADRGRRAAGPRGGAAQWQPRTRERSFTTRM